MVLGVLIVIGYGLFAWLVWWGLYKMDTISLGWRCSKCNRRIDMRRLYSKPFAVERWTQSECCHARFREPEDV